MVLRCQARKKDGSRCNREIEAHEAYVLSKREDVDPDFSEEDIPLRKKNDLVAIEKKYGWGNPVCLHCLPLKKIQAELMRLEIWSFSVENRGNYLAKKFARNSPEGGPAMELSQESVVPNFLENEKDEVKKMSEVINSDEVDEDEEWVEVTREDVKANETQESEEYQEEDDDEIVDEDDFEDDEEEDSVLASLLEESEDEDEHEEEIICAPEEDIHVLRKQCYCCNGTFVKPLHFLPDILEVSNPIAKWRGSPVCEKCGEAVKHAQLPIHDIREKLFADLAKNKAKYNPEGLENNPFCPLCLEPVRENDRWLDIKVGIHIPMFDAWKGQKFCPKCIPRLYQAHLKVWPLTAAEREERQNRNFKRLVERIHREEHDADSCVHCGNYLKGMDHKTVKINRRQEPGTPMYEYRGRLVCEECVETFKRAGVSLFFPYRKQQRERQDLSDMLENGGGKKNNFGANVGERQRHKKRRRNIK